MLAILRILFGFALLAWLGKAVEVAGPDPQTEGTTDAGFMAVAVFLAIANAVVWAPWVGQWLADPLTGAFTAGHPADFANPTLQLAHKLSLRRWRRAALFFAFLEGVRHPDLPGAFVLGMQQAREGSWLEKVFAREVWRFDNADHCLKAWKILRRHGIEPDLHRRPEVNLLLLAQTREVPPPPAVLEVPSAPPAPKPVRNPRIRIFDGAARRPPESVSVTGPAAEEAPRSAGRAESSPVSVSGAAGGTEGEGVGETPPPSPAGPVRLAVSGGGVRRPRRRLTWAERIEALFTGELDG